jgi:hypothetical protein
MLYMFSGTFWCKNVKHYKCLVGIGTWIDSGFLFQGNFIEVKNQKFLLLFLEFFEIPVKSLTIYKIY